MPIVYFLTNEVFKLDPKVHDFVDKVLENDDISLRGKKVLNFLLKHGSITTADIAAMGYDHPPRAIRDVRDAGIPLITKMETDAHKKRHARYVFGDSSDIKEHMIQGRVTFPKSFKKKLLKIQGNRCAICNQKFDPEYLQIDHRVPYEYNGDSKDLDPKDYMLLCAECNRIKDRATQIGCAKTCFKTHDIKIIRSCYWASPEHYTHICMKPIRRLTLTWLNEKQVHSYDIMATKAKQIKLSPQQYIKKLIQEDNKKQ